MRSGRASRMADPAPLSIMRATSSSTSMQLPDKKPDSVKTTAIRSLMRWIMAVRILPYFPNRFLLSIVKTPFFASPFSGDAWRDQNTT